MTTVHNVLRTDPATPPAEEVFRTLLLHPSSGTRIEQIHSQGQASPEGFWYDQPNDEWVMLLQGEAKLAIQGEPHILLCKGDSLHLPAHVKHRVESTSCDAVWLAVHLGGDLPSLKGD